MHKLVALAPVLLSIALASCAHGPVGLNRGSNYQSFLDSRLDEDRLYDDGRAIVHVKAMPADAALVAEQEKLFPSQALKIDPSKRQVVVAMTILGRDPFSSADVKFLLGGTASSEVVEISDQTLIQAQYPFAFPFHRLFVVSFSGGDSAPAKLEVRTPVGPVEVEIAAPAAGGAS